MNHRPLTPHIIPYIPTEDGDKWRKRVHGVATLGSGTAEDHMRSDQIGLPTKWRSYCDHGFCDVTSPYVYIELI